MENGNIREVVLAFNRIIDNIPSQYDNFDNALSDIFEAFHSTMSAMLPLKYFAICGDEFGSDIAIFDNTQAKDNWIRKVHRSCFGDSVACNEIDFSKFVELSCDEWSNPNCYVEEWYAELVFRL